MVKRIVGYPLLLICVLWGTAALWFDGPASRLLAGTLAGSFALASLALPILVRNKRTGVMSSVALMVAVLVWWYSIPARNDRTWLPEVAQLPQATIQGNTLTVHNVRNFDYRSETEFTERWETRQFKLDHLRGLDLFMSYWGPRRIAHTIASWKFADGGHLAVSIETRKEKGESYSALRGFFRQFEVYYVVADERDVIGLRAAHRGEQVFLYRLRHPVEQARALLLDYMAEINRLTQSPRWYNALTHNCTTAIRYHAKRVDVAKPWNWRLLANGYLDELGYERGAINTSLPFDELRRRSDITEKAKAAIRQFDFSLRIREGLPKPDPHGSG